MTLPRVGLCLQNDSQHYITVTLMYFRVLSVVFGYLRLLSCTFGYLRLLSCTFGYLRLLSGTFGYFHVLAVLTGTYIKTHPLTSGVFSMLAHVLTHAWRYTAHHNNSAQHGRLAACLAPGTTRRPPRTGRCGWPPPSRSRWCCPRHRGAARPLHAIGQPRGKRSSHGGGWVGGWVRGGMGRGGEGGEGRGPPHTASSWDAPLSA